MTFYSDVDEKFKNDCKKNKLLPFHIFNKQITPCSPSNAEHCACPGKQIYLHVAYSSELDGFLRFHNFKRRIMVYEDPSRNNSRDLKRRMGEILQEGDELQLQPPVFTTNGRYSTNEPPCSSSNPEYRTCPKVRQHWRIIKCHGKGWTPS